MSKQVIVHWTPSPSTDVAEQQLIFRKGQGIAQTYRLGPHVREWSTKAHGPLEEGTTIHVTIKTIDTQGLQDSNPPSKSFTIPAEAPQSASNLTFEVRDFEGGPTGPVGPTGPTA